MAFFTELEQKKLKIHMEIQKTPKSQKKKKKSWETRMELKESIFPTSGYTTKLHS